jgi:hypothetical protein
MNRKSRGLGAAVLLALALSGCRLSEPEDAPPSVVEMTARLQSLAAVYVAVAEGSVLRMESQAQEKFKMGFGNAIEYGDISPRDSTGWLDAYSDPKLIEPIPGLRPVYAKMAPVRCLEFVRDRPDQHGLTLDHDRPGGFSLNKADLPAVLKALGDAGLKPAPIELYEDAGSGAKLLFRESVPAH